MSADAPAIVVSELAKHFGKVRAVDGLSFDVRAGEIFGLVGPDGAGKTTTMRILAGVLLPDSGSATVGGFDVARNPESAKHHLSYMPQRFGLYEDLTIDENIRFYADLFGVRKAERERRGTELLAAAGLAEFHERLAGKLSGGMKQKLGLICALIHRPRVVLLDEPTNGVDPVSRRDFWAILYSLLDEGVAILASTSYLDEAERCHRVGLIHQGKMLFCDTPPELKKKFPGVVLSLRTPAAGDAMHALATAPGVRSSVLVGDSIHVFVNQMAEHAQEGAAQLRAELEKRGIPVDALEAKEPSIEDLFVSAVEPHGAVSGAERRP
jgi:ABC-2 type transport system ATP-binding protein